MLRDVLEGKMKGKRGRGRPRTGMVSELKGAETYEVIRRRRPKTERGGEMTKKDGSGVWTCPWAEHLRRRLVIMNLSLFYIIAFFMGVK